MDIIETPDSKKLIPINTFEICKLDNKNRKDITEMFPTRGAGAYYLDKFINHLSLNHGISIVEYLENCFGFIWPKCPISGERVGYKVTGKGLFLSKFKKGRISKEHSEAFKKSCEGMSRNRTGDSNPMRGKKPWNKGLSKENNDIIKNIAEGRKGKKHSEETRKKMRLARERHPLKIRHPQKHSEESKQKMRDATVSRWKNGDFSFKKTSIEKKVELWLLDNGFEFVYQHPIAGFVADFACPLSKIVIECQGDFFHCNPDIEKYSEPKYDVQRRNVYRDSLKRDVYKKQGWFLIELWESDINSGYFKDILRNKLKK